MFIGVAGRMALILRGSSLIVWRRTRVVTSFNARPTPILLQAIALRRPQPGLMHHSDRGSQYCAYEYRDKLKDIGAVVSISGKGNCYDNAVVETFFKTL